MLCLSLRVSSCKGTRRILTFPTCLNNSSKHKILQAAVSITPTNADINPAHQSNAATQHKTQNHQRVASPPRPPPASFPSRPISSLTHPQKSPLTSGTSSSNTLLNSFPLTTPSPLIKSAARSATP